MCDKFIDGFTSLEFITGAAIYNAFFDSAIAHFAIRTMTNLYTSAFTGSTIDHVGCTIKIMHLCPFRSGFFP